MILQATINGALSADYTIIVLVGVVGVMTALFIGIISWSVTRVLKQIEVQLKQMGERIDQVVDEHVRLEKEVIIMKTSMPSPESLAAQIALKLQALGAMREL